MVELETLNREPNLIDLQDLVCKMPTKLREIKRKQKVAKKAFSASRNLYGIDAENYSIQRGTNERDSEIIFVFNLSGQPVKWYSLGEFGDVWTLSPEEDFYVSEHLKTYCLYVETLNSWYEI